MLERIKYLTQQQQQKISDVHDYAFMKIGINSDDDLPLNINPFVPNAPFF